MFKSEAKSEFGTTAIISGAMETAIRYWMDIYSGRPDWVDPEDNIKTIKFAKSICSETARLVTLAIGVSFDGNRGDYMENWNNSAVMPHLRKWVEYGCAFGTIVLKPNGNGVDIVTPANFEVTEVDGMGKITGMRFQDRYKSGDNWYTKLEQHSFRTAKVRYEESGEYEDVTFYLIKDFSEQVIAPAMQAMAQQIDADLLAVGISKANKKATVSDTPAITDIAGVGKALDMAKAPRANRRLVLPPTILYKYNTLDNFAKQCYKGDSAALQESEIGKVYSCETFMSQNCPENQNDTPGTVKSYKVAGTKNATQFTVSDGTTAASTIKKGDQLIVNGYLYTVTEDVTLASGAGTVKVDQNIPDNVAATDAFVVNKAHALGFHRNGLALVTRNLELPMGNKNAYIASADGLGIRVVFDYDSDHKQDKVSFDIIYGIKELDADLLVDFA